MTKEQQMLIIKWEKCLQRLFLQFKEILNKIILDHQFL